ncbi:MmcB family DNA repair protein [Roseibaca sp. Y0-43]|uniref:MmcB family DNA repair protein n=1 Tax=Roseibaca sp. Y0-43 TaxID=2816854 RepID=UPI001D0CB49D|nr:MmcB family DNA repair protein [Roseibaca sp. Y0-43]MCC1481540.1 MmcB family DNA repair protein [Roseibaca sp. Y0-43]
MEDRTDHPTSAPGILLARGVCRALADLGFAPICEFVIARGLRVDVLALGPKGDVWIVECKSSLADFRSDRKWQNYLPWCDRFFWAVDADFPREVLPDGHGLILADRFGAELLEMGEEARLAPARRKAVTLSVARTGLRRLHHACDPGVRM